MLSPNRLVSIFGTVILCFSLFNENQVNACGGGNDNELQGSPKISVVDYIEDLDLNKVLPNQEIREEFRKHWHEVRDIFEGFDLRALMGMLSTRQASNATCQMCSQLLSLAKAFVTDKSVLMQIVTSVCNKPGSGINRDVCFGAVDRLGDQILYIIHNTSVSMGEGCAVLGGHRCLEYLDIGSKQIYWEVPIPKSKPFNPIKVPVGKPKKVLHISDVHLDLWYTEGGSALCDAPLCCRSTSVAKSNFSKNAEFWSQPDGDCDIPVKLVENAFSIIGERHGNNLDYFFWTGDNPPHDIWNTSIQGNFAHIKEVTDAIKKNLKNTTIIPVLGNHEAHPINMYVPEAVSEISNFSTKWLYEKLANDYWAEWIDTPEAKKTFLKGGYYAKQLTPNWRAVVLNSNDGYKSNFWVAYNPGDTDGQLAWLVDELDKAETKGYYVSILAHIPPTGDMYDAWLHNYVRIVERYAHLITGGYNGHTHKDEIGIVYDVSGKKPLGVNYIAGSLTTYSNLNPMYKIYDMDLKGMPLDYQTYYTDLVKDNLEHSRNATSVPLWVEGFRATEAYKLADLTPTSWDQWRTTGLNDTKMAKLYYQNYHRSSTGLLKLFPPMTPFFIKNFSRPQIYVPSNLLCNVS